MTTSITHTADQEAAIRYFRKKHNAKHRTTFTNGTFADFKVADLFNRMVELMNEERASEELLEAFRLATPTQQAAARAALSISEP